MKIRYSQINEYAYSCFLDIDECKIQNIMCKDGMCENTAGSYMCTCREGYELAADKRTCVGAYLRAHLFCIVSLFEDTFRGKIYKLPNDYIQRLLFFVLLPAF